MQTFDFPKCILWVSLLSRLDIGTVRLVVVLLFGKYSFYIQHFSKYKYVYEINTMSTITVFFWLITQGFFAGGIGLPKMIIFIL